MSSEREVLLFNVDGANGDDAVVRVVRSAGMRANGYGTPETLQILFRKLEIISPEYDDEGTFRSCSRVALFSEQSIRVLRDACDRALAPVESPSKEVPA